MKGVIGHNALSLSLVRTGMMMMLIMMIDGFDVL
jgi:hypothetical protein